MVIPAKHPAFRLLAMGVLLLTLAVRSVVVSAAEVSAELDRGRVVMGETVTLVLQTEDAQQSVDPDLAAVEVDFRVLDQRSETRMSIVNGRQSAVVRQLITLEPKRAGELIVPPLTLPGGATTPALSLTVAPAPEVPPGQAPPVFIEVDLDPVEGPYYVHAQIALRVRIHYQQNLTEAAINPPAPEQAAVRLLDEVPFTADRDGERYRVLERRYAIFPERSGELVIPPMRLTGRLIERSSDRLWQPSVRGRRISVESDPVTVSVEPRPPGFSGDHWLPAREVRLAQQITDGEEVRAGEPVTRTVMLDAVGLEEHMLAEPAWPELENARIYPDRPQGISRDNGEWVLGHREFRYAVVPEGAGELLLPEIKVDWWDTVNDRQRTAVLPEHRVSVLPSEADAPPSVSVAAAGDDVAGRNSPDSGHWRVLTLLFAVLWLGTLALYALKAGVRQPKPAGGTGSEAESVMIRAFAATCRSGDAAAARRHLRRWLRRHGPSWAGGSLGEFASGVNAPELSVELRALDAAGFRPEDEAPWNGEALARAFRHWRREGSGDVAGDPDDEPDLYAAARRAP